MKIALITTTINVPRVLKLYRKLGPNVSFFVMADEKTPLEAYEFCADIPDCEIYSPDRQRELGYSCSELIGWNCVERRSLAILEAVKSGAYMILSVDDDNFPIDRTYMDFEHPGLWNGLKVSSPTGWFDPGFLLVPQTKHRGFPIDAKSRPVFEPATDIKIGVAQGLCLGDPDIDAVTRIAMAPMIHSVSELARGGVVVDHSTLTVFNSQNTAFVRHLAPAMFQPPGVGRYSDIYASLICQRVMREHDLHVHFGPSFIWQERNRHGLLTDLRNEINGMMNVQLFGAWLDQYVFGPGVNSIIAQVRALYTVLLTHAWWPKNASESALAFCDDIEPLL